MVRSVVSINGTKYKVKCTAVVVRGVTRGQGERNYPGAFHNIFVNLVNRIDHSPLRK